MRLFTCFFSLALTLVSVFALAEQAPPQQESVANDLTVETKKEVQKIIPEELLKLRDPFKRPQKMIAHAQPKSELEMYSVADFKLLGVVTGPEKIKAMILAPNGKTYFVAENQKLGDKKGIIKKITSDKVQVVEKAANLLAVEETVTSEILLPSDSKLRVSVSRGNGNQAPTLQQNMIQEGQAQ